MKNNNIKICKELTKEFTINKNSIELFLEVEVDGEIVIQKKADSLVSNFLKILYGLMGGRQSLPPSSFVNYNHISGNGGGYRIQAIDSTGSDVSIQTDNDSINTGASGYLQISGVVTNSGTELNGVWEYTFDKHGGTGDWLTLLGTGSGGDYEIDGGLANIVYPDIEDPIYPGSRAFYQPSIVVSTSVGDIEIDSYFVEDQIGMRDSAFDNYLRAGNMNISEPFSDDTTSLFTLSRSFFNMTEETINIRKAGLFTRLPTVNSTINDQALLIAEDYISKDLAPTETLTVNYKLRNATTVAGGILEQFNKILYTIMSGNWINTRNIDGENTTSWWGNTAPGWSVPFITSSAGADNKYPFLQYTGTIENTRAGWKIGPTLGSADRAVKTTDWTLLDQNDEDSTIQHGKEAGQLMFYGSTVHSWQEDTTNGRAQFTISRFFENSSPGNVVVRQIGLNCAIVCHPQSGSNKGPSATQLYCLSSNTLVSDDIFAPGDVGRVNIILSIEV